MNLLQPQIIKETDDYAVVFKPPRMHSEPNKQKSGDTLSEWFGKGELLHRLDYDTHGLVLFAKNKKSFNFFKELQDNGEFVKEYSAVSEGDSDFPRIVMSYFRPFGPGRKQVRPETETKKYRKIAKDKGGFYRTEIINIKKSEKGNIFTVRIKRGFRHQIRSHLSWIGCPILNDPLYNPLCDPCVSAQSLRSCEAYAKTLREEKYLALRAHALFFTDPKTGEKKECRIDPIMI